MDISSDKESRKAQVTGKLQKRDEERLIDLQKRKDVKDSTSAANENANYFTENFQKIRCQLETAIEKSNGLPKKDMIDHFDSMTVLYQSMQKFLTDSTGFLPGREVLKSQEVITKLLNDIQAKRDEVIPKKKFAFKGKKTVDLPKKVEEIKEVKPTLDNLGIDMVDCNFANKNKSDLFKSSDEINNKDIALSKLEDCCVRLEGSPSAIHMNNLTRCKVFCGPVSGSIFIDDCIDCTFVLACQQLRIHSTTASHFYIHVTSKAIIEDCKTVEFAPYNLKYSDINSHYELSGLNRDINNWDDVDDFNWLASDQASPNWKVLHESQRVHEWN